MKKITLLVALFFATFLTAQNNNRTGISLQITEIDADQAGNDEMEFVELYSSSTNTSLNGYIVVFYNGSDNESYRTIDLTGQSTDANGYLMLGGDLFADADIMMGPDNVIQNGADAIAIYFANAADFPDDTPVTNTGLVDAVVYGTSDSDDMELLTTLNEATQWDENANGMKDVESIQLDLMTGTFCAGTPTPRAANIDCSMVCPLNVFVMSVTCDAVTDGVDTYTTTLGFTGGGTATYSIMTTEGMVSGDNPSMMAEGEITITGVNEGVDFDYTVTGPNCDIMNTISATTCEPAATINSIAELRAGTIGNEYILSSEALITFAQDFRNQKFIEDPTAAILIDDSAGTITTAYNIGDGITGLEGTLTEFGGLLQFRPLVDPGMPSSTGNTITPQVVEISDLGTNPENYESEYVQIGNAVAIDATANPQWVVGTEYIMVGAEDAGEFTFRTSFFDVDYIGLDVPTSPNTIVSGIITERNDGEYFITARDLNDFTELLSVNENDIEGFVMYPNPASNEITFTTANQDVLSITIFDVTGKQVMNVTTKNTLRIDNLQTGLYIVKAIQNGAATTAKLIVE